MLLVESAGLVLLAAAGTLTSALIGTALVGAGVSLIFPAIVALTLDRTGGGRAGTAVGVTTSFWDLGILAAGPIGGLLTHQGYPWAAAAAGGAIVIVICLGSKSVVAQPIRGDSPARR